MFLVIFFNTLLKKRKRVLDLWHVMTWVLQGYQKGPIDMDTV